MIFAWGLSFLPVAALHLHVRTERAACRKARRKGTFLFGYKRGRILAGQFWSHGPMIWTDLCESCRQSLHPMTIPLLIPTQALDLDLVWR